MSKKIIQTLELNPDSALIEFYVNAHSPAQIWPEIVKGIKKVGIINMEIYRKDTLLVMIMEVPDDFDYPSAMSELSTLDRQQEWEEYVGRAQKCDENSSSADKWQPMQRIFNLLDCGD